MRLLKMVKKLVNVYVKLTIGLWVLVGLGELWKEHTEHPDKSGLQCDEAILKRAYNNWKTGLTN